MLEHQSENFHKEDESYKTKFENLSICGDVKLVVTAQTCTG